MDKSKTILGLSVTVFVGLVIALIIFYDLIKAMFTNPTKMSDKGIALLIQAEGFRTRAYKDSKGKWTTGAGHLIKLPQEQYLITTTLTPQQVKDLLKKDLSVYEAEVSKHVTVPISQNQFDALVMLCFNLGGPQFDKTSLLRDFNSRKSTKEIEQDFKKWIDGGLLINRRTIESRLFVSGIYSDKVTKADIEMYLAA